MNNKTNIQVDVWKLIYYFRKCNTVHDWGFNCKLIVAPGAAVSIGALWVGHKIIFSPNCF